MINSSRSYDSRIVSERNENYMILSTTLSGDRMRRSLFCWKLRIEHPMFISYALLKNIGGYNANDKELTDSKVGDLLKNLLILAFFVL